MILMPPRARSGAACGIALLERGSTLPSSTDAAFDTASDTIWNHNHPVRALAAAARRFASP
jgi:hypothetical protein